MSTATVLSSDEKLTSLELWAASKLIGRECATAGKEYFLCKKEKGQNPALCQTQAQKVISCTTSIVETTSRKFPDQYRLFQKCLDENDYKFDDCRKQEKTLLDCWNGQNN